MTKLYRELSTEELRSEIKQLSANQKPGDADYDTKSEGITPLERYLKELHRRGEAPALKNGGETPPG